MTLKEPVRRAPGRPPIRIVEPRPHVVAQIDHAALAHNVAVLRGHTTSALLAVVKANAFGHGAVEVARTVLHAGAEWLGVATIVEALELRAAGITAPVLAWLVDPWSDLDAAVRRTVTVSCANIPTLESVAGAARVVGASADVHLEVDTGMARGGAAPEEWTELCRRAAELESAGLLRVTGVWSHLARATRPEWARVASAHRSFVAAVAAARAEGLTPRHAHLANTAATLAHPRTAFDMVRCGAGIFGIDTVEGRRHGLRPTLRLTTRVTQLRAVPAGTGVSYDHAHVTAAPTTLALLPVGYADGVPRALAHGGTVSIRGVRCPVVGLVTMDQLVVDVGTTTVALGDEVVLLGDPEKGEPGVTEWAAVAGTLPHEILTGLGRRVLREHIGVPA